MRVLIMTGGFAGPSRQPWLMDDLAEALADVGHSVEVVVFDSKDPRPRGEQQSHGLGIRCLARALRADHEVLLSGLEATSPSQSDYTFVPSGGRGKGIMTSAYLPPRHY